MHQHTFLVTHCYTVIHPRQRHTFGHSISHTSMDGPPYATTHRDPDGHGPCIREKQAHKLKTCTQPSRERPPEPHSDTARQLVAQSHSHTHFRNGHVSTVPPQECPDYTAMYHSHGTPTAVSHRLPAVLSHHPRKTVSLPANTEVTQASIGPCIITAHVDRHTISHTQKHQHAISISHT